MKCHEGLLPQIGKHLATFNLSREADLSLHVTIADASGVRDELGESGAPLQLCAMNALRAALSSRTPSPSGAREILRAEIINAPETADFMAAVPLEAAHQRERWGSDHDTGKAAEDWVFLVGWLLGKASQALKAGDIDKARHHTISSAAALANWHAAISGADNQMRPGIDPEERAIESALRSQGRGEGFQARVDQWLLACFGEEIARDRVERNHRFLEEALELVQACGCTVSEAHQLVDYTFGRPVGERGQEIGGVMNTLAALCLAYGDDMAAEGDTEIARCWAKIDRIRAKQAAKPKHSPLPLATISEGM